MNKLLIHEGGQPLHLDDLEFLQEVATSPLQSLISSWGNCILGGCEITYDKTTSVHHWNDGFIAYQGSVYRVSAGTIDQVDQADTFYWLFSRTETASKVFEDGAEHNTQVVYVAQLASMRFAPEAGDYIADKNLPRLGVDFARSPRLSYSYNGIGSVVNFQELSRYSGILTMRFEPKDALPTTGHFGTFLLSGINNMAGRYTFVDPNMPPTDIDVVNGKLTCRQKLGEGFSRSHATLEHRTYISILISWDYEENNGDGAGINDDSGNIPPRDDYGRGNGHVPPRRR